MADRRHCLPLPRNVCAWWWVCRDREPVIRDHSHRTMPTDANSATEQTHPIAHSKHVINVMNVLYVDDVRCKHSQNDEDLYVCVSLSYIDSPNGGQSHTQKKNANAQIAIAARRRRARDSCRWSSRHHAVCIDPPIWFFLVVHQIRIWAHKQWLFGRNIPFHDSLCCVLCMRRKLWCLFVCTYELMFDDYRSFRSIDSSPICAFHSNNILYTNSV